LNRDPSRADYALEAIERTTNPVTATEVSRYRFTLFNRAGNVTYSTSPHKFSNAITNVCMALARQTAKDATAPVEVPDTVVTWLEPEDPEALQRAVVEWAKSEDPHEFEPK